MPPLSSLLQDIATFLYSFFDCDLWWSHFNDNDNQVGGGVSYVAIAVCYHQRHLTTPVKPIHQGKKKKNLLPDEHLMDMGYTTADNLISPEKDYDVTVIGPVRSEPSWPLS